MFETILAIEVLILVGIATYQHIKIQKLERKIEKEQGEPDED